MLSTLSLLQRWRSLAQLSQRDAAALLGVSQPIWSSWENGRSRPRLDKALALERLTERRVPIEAWGYAPSVVDIVRDVARGREARP